MESIMNSIFKRIFLMAALLSFFNISYAGDGLLDIEINQYQLVEDEQPTTEMGDNHGARVEHGDILKIETGAPSTPQPMQMNQELTDIKLPSRGMNKAAVKSEFGNPLQMNPAVGKPPISSWSYENYTVYFEHEWVLHSVLNRK